jgi:hypothetical protein
VNRSPAAAHAGSGCGENNSSTGNWEDDIASFDRRAAIAMRTALLSTDAQLIALQTAMAQSSCISNAPAAAAAAGGDSDADGDVDMLSQQQQQQQQQPLRYVKGDPFADETPDLQAWAEAFPYLCVQGVSLLPRQQQRQQRSCILGEDDCSIGTADISSFQPESCSFQPVAVDTAAAAAAAGASTAMQVVSDSDQQQQQQQQHSAAATAAPAQRSSHSSRHISSSTSSSDDSTLAVIGTSCCIHQSCERDFGESQDGGKVEEIYAADGILEVSKTCFQSVYCSFPVVFRTLYGTASLWQSADTEAQLQTAGTGITQHLTMVTPLQC